MDELKAVNLEAISAGLKDSVKPVSILWQAPDTIAFVARGRKNRSEFHSDPSDEVMYMIKGEMSLHYLTSDGQEKVAVVKQGEIIYCPAGVRHSPRFSPDAYLLVLERKRRPEELDRFFWYCEKCREPLYEAVKHVADYRDDPVSKVYEEFYSAESHRNCGKCGHVTPRPS
jgi:3-hydroxyanthranilate 3,4-dioxygenase